MIRVSVLVDFCLICLYCFTLVVNPKLGHFYVKSCIIDGMHMTVIAWTYIQVIECCTHAKNAYKVIITAVNSFDSHLHVFS